MKVKATYSKDNALVNMPLRMITGFDAHICDVLTRNEFGTLAEVADGYEVNNQAFTRLKGFKSYMQDWLHTYLIVNSYVVEVKPIVEDDAPPKAKVTKKQTPVKKVQSKPEQVNKPSKIDNS